jgi:GrpB-like predicted nucleotidyltransferase (UPF0157 family)
MSQNEEPVYLVPYDPTWSSHFADEVELLTPVLAPWRAGAIEHIGSTAVPGLSAKPVIDIMAPVVSLPAALGAREPLAALGYLYFPYRADVMHWFCKPSLAHRTHHLHLVAVGSVLWRERLAFRDYLRQSDEARAEYAALKATLAERYRFDREGYTEAKGPFIQRMVERALTKHVGSDTGAPSA